MTQKGNSVPVCALVILLELICLARGQQSSSTCQPVPGPPGRDGRDGNCNCKDGSPGINGRDGSPAVFTHEDFLKLKEMLINEFEGAFCSQNSSPPITCRTFTQTVTSTGVDQSKYLCPTPTPSTVPTVTETEYLTINQTVTSTQVVYSTAPYPTATPQASTTMTTSTSTVTPDHEVQRDCRVFLSNGFNQSGVYTIQPDSLHPFKVYCDMDTDGGGWTVLQRRQDGSVDFYRNWDNYTAGFGNLSGEFWLGLDYINRITNASSSELRIDLADFENGTRFAKYSSFQVDAASTKYVLNVSGYSGTAGDSIDISGSQGNNGHPFSTFDQDNDNWAVENCAQFYEGAWWFNGCHTSELNGLYLGGSDSAYAKGVIWPTWRGYGYSLKFTEMKTRPSN